MRIVQFGLAALAVFAVTSCKPAEKAGVADASGFVMSAAVAELDKSLEGLRKGDFKVSGGSQADIPALVAALPKTLSVKFAGQSFDAGSGATVLTQVSITDSNFPDAAIQIGELKLWQLDTTFAVARLSGQRLGDSGKLARRIEAKDVAVTGLDKTMDKFMKGFMSEMPAGSGADLDVKFNRYDVRLPHAVFDNISLRPFLLKPVTLEADNPLKDVMPFVQSLAAYLNATSVDAWVYDNFAIDTDVDNMGMKQTQKVEIGVMAGRGFVGGDTAAALSRGIKQDVSMSGGSMGDKPITITGTDDIYTTEGVKFSKVLGYVAQGVLPPRTDTDLMSLGVLKIGAIHYAMGGKPVVDSKSATFDGSGFYWLIPTRLSGEAKDVVVHIDNLMEYFGTMSAGDGAGGAPAMKAQTDVLKKYGLGAPVLNFSGAWNWDPKGGAAKIDWHAQVGGWDKVDLKLEGGLPTFDQVSAQIPDNGNMSEAQQEAMMKLVTSSTLLRAFNFDLVDEGGSAKVFGLIADMMAADPSTPKGSAPTAQTMKDESINQLNTSASQMKEQSPAIAAVMAAFAEFLSKGAPVHIAANPNPPVTGGDFDKLMNGDKAASDRLNVTVNGKKP